MATYTINSRVIFNDKMGSLSLTEGIDDPIILAAPASRLLTLLIKNSNTVLTRNEILTEVWENHGLVASSNNLYHYISVIRKSLASLGEDNIIVTLPKIGFSMKALSIVTECEEQQNILPYVEEVLDEQVLFNTKLTESTSRINKKLHHRVLGKKKIELAIFSLLIITITIIYLTYSNKNQAHSDFPPISKVQKCIVSPLKEHSLSHDKLIINEIKNQVSQYKLDCNRVAHIFFSNEKDYKLLYYCTAPSGTTPNSQDCINIIVDNEVSL